MLEKKKVFLAGATAPPCPPAMYGPDYDCYVHDSIHRAQSQIHVYFIFSYYPELDFMYSIKSICFSYKWTLSQYSSTVL